VITRLFKRQKRLDSSDASDRKAAIEGLSPDQACERGARLAELAARDADRDVRAAALMKIRDPALLEALLNATEAENGVANHVARLVSEGIATGLADHPAVIRARLADNPSADLIRLILDGADESLLLEAVLECPREQKPALLEHAAFHRSSVLVELERRSRGRDKRLNRFARSRLDELRQSRSEAEQLCSRISDRLTMLEHPATADPAQQAKKHQALMEMVRTELLQLADISNHLSGAGESVGSLADLNRRHDAIAAADATAESASARSAAEPEAPDTTAESKSARPATLRSSVSGDAEKQAPVRDQPFEELTSAFEALDQQLQQNIDFSAVIEHGRTLTDQWLASSDRLSPSDAQHATFERVSHRFQELADAHSRLQAISLPPLDPLQIPERPPEKMADAAQVWSTAEGLKSAIVRARRALSEVNWPEWAPRAESLESYQATIAAVNTRLQAWQSWARGIETRASAGLERLEAHIDAGEVRNARSEVAELRSMLSTLPRHTAQPLARQLARSSARVAELDDWQTFATSPKRESLCETMTRLASEPLAPREQAQRIKQLRTEWNELGPISRAADHRLLERFNEAAEHAFEPCRAYFSEQAKERERNLEGRREICDSLATYLESTEWTRADYKAAELIMRTARQEWRRYHPVDRNPGKPVEARFENLQAQLHEHIKEEWDRNLARKQEIVDRAREIADADQDVRQKIEDAKSLQQQWKAVGSTPRRPDQILWRDFRKICDAIFEQRDQAQRNADAAIQSNQQQGQQLIEEFRGLLDGAREELDAPALRIYQRRFDAIPPLPERLQRSLDREFSELLRSARQALHDARTAAERARLAQLQEMDAQVSELEQRHLDGDSVQFEPPDPLFAERWQLIDSAVPVDLLRRLVVEAEIAAELDSAESDRELRMALQVDLMNTGRGRQALEADPAELVARWCAMGPKCNAMDSLRVRFFAAIERIAGY